MPERAALREKICEVEEFSRWLSTVVLEIPILLTNKCCFAIIVVIDLYDILLLLFYYDSVNTQH